jgi:hypothetical protein
MQIRAGFSNWLDTTLTKLLCKTGVGTSRITLEEWLNVQKNFQEETWSFWQKQKKILSQK